MTKLQEPLSYTQLVSDNMPYSSKEFKEFKRFANDWGFKLTTSSLTYPRSNGLCVKAVQTFKKQTPDEHFDKNVHEDEIS